MSDTEWTPSLVEARIVEAVDVLTRLPEARVQGYYSLWPGIMPEFSDLVGRKPEQDMGSLGRPRRAGDRFVAPRHVFGVPDEALRRSGDHRFYAGPGT